MSASISPLRPKPIPVTPDNFLRAESDLYFGNLVKLGGFGKFYHIRAPAPIDNQTIIRMNRDTLYSGAVFDLDAGPVTVKLPDPGTRFLSLQAFDEDEYVWDQDHCTCGAGACRKTLTHEDWQRDDVQARYRGHFHPYIQAMIDRKGKKP